MIINFQWEHEDLTYTEWQWEGLTSVPAKGDHVIVDAADADWVGEAYWEFVVTRRVAFQNGDWCLHVEPV